MKTYITPSVKELTLRGSEMLAESTTLQAKPDTFTDTEEDGGWTRGQGWSSSDWSASDAE